MYFSSRASNTVNVLMNESREELSYQLFVSIKIVYSSGISGWGFLHAAKLSSSMIQLLCCQRFCFFVLFFIPQYGTKVYLLTDVGVNVLEKLDNKTTNNTIIQ